MVRIRFPFVLSRLPSAELLWLSLSFWVVFENGILCGHGPLSVLDGVFPDGAGGSNAGRVVPCARAVVPRAVNGIDRLRSFVCKSIRPFSAVDYPWCCLAFVLHVG